MRASVVFGSLERALQLVSICGAGSVSEETYIRNQAEDVGKFCGEIKFPIEFMSNSRD